MSNFRLIILVLLLVLNIVWLIGTIRITIWDYKYENENKLSFFKIYFGKDCIYQGWITVIISDLACV